MKKSEKYAFILIALLLVIVISILIALSYIDKSKPDQIALSESGMVQSAEGNNQSSLQLSEPVDTVQNADGSLSPQIISESVKASQTGCDFNNPPCPIYDECVNNICRDIVVGAVTKHQYETEGRVYRYNDNKINVSCFGCNEGDAEFIDRSIELEYKSMKQLNSFLGVSLKSPLQLTIYLGNTYPIKEQTCQASSGNACVNYGDGGGNVAGFKGFIMGGESRVTRLSNLRMSIHEDMHQYTNQFIKLGSVGQYNSIWFNEAMSISIAMKIQNSSSDNTLMLMDALRADPRDYADLKAGRVSEDKFNSNFYYANNPHVAGSIFLIALEKDYDCNSSCVAGIWKRLANVSDGLLANSTISNQDIKQASEAETGRDLTPLFNLLRIS